MKVATLAGLAEVAGLAFPLNALVTNSAWMPMVEPETCSHVGLDGASEVTLRDASHLKRVIGNIEQLNTLNGFGDGVGLALEFDAPKAKKTKAQAASGEGDKE